MLTFHTCSYKYSYMTLPGCSNRFLHTEPFIKKRRNSSRSQVRENVLNNQSLSLALIVIFAASFLCCTVSACCVLLCSLAPSCGAVQGDLLHLAQLGQQPLHAVLELRQTGQRFRRLQFPCVVKPALQHWGGQAEEQELEVSNMPTDSRERLILFKQSAWITLVWRLRPIHDDTLLTTTWRLQRSLGCYIISCIIKNKSKLTFWIDGALI